MLTFLLLGLALVTSSLTEGVVHLMPSEVLQKCREERLKHPLVSDLPYNDADRISPNLWVGNLCASRNEAFLLRNNITLVVSVAHEHQIEGYYGNIRYAYVPGLRDVLTDDFGTVNFAIHEALSIIAGHEREGSGNILIYCNMGVSRSVTVAAAYLLQSPEIGFSNVYDLVAYIRQKRHVARPNSQYLLILRLRLDASYAYHQRMSNLLRQQAFIKKNKDLDL